jgi:hypothetical protein
MAQSFLTEFLRVWKLATLALGIAMLIAGSFQEKAPDCDSPISFVMAVRAYLTEP